MGGRDGHDGRDGRDGHDGLGGHDRGDEDDERDESGRILRPDVVVLGDDALVPGPGVVSPPPRRLTHEVVRDEPYWFGPHRRGDREPDGVLPAGTPVAVLGAEGGRARVVDATGRLVEIPAASLRPRPDDRREPDEPSG